MTIQKNTARDIVVSFQPSCAGLFHADLWITLSDKGRAKDREFTVIRELRGRAILPGGLAINRDAPNNVEDTGEGEGTGITVSHDLGLEFSVECPRSDGPFPTQTKELIITKSSETPLVSFIAAIVRSPDDAVTRWVQFCGWGRPFLILFVNSIFSAQFEGDSNKITPKGKHILTVSFMPRQEGLCGAALELKFHDHKRKMDFVIRRTLSGCAKNGWTGDHSNVSMGDGDGEGDELSDTGISVSDEEGLNVGIVERRRPNGPFASATSSLSIKLADGFPAVTFLQEKIKTSDGSDSAYV
jgi:hypothetical protein